MTYPHDFRVVLVFQILRIKEQFTKASYKQQRKSYKRNWARGYKRDATLEHLAKFPFQGCILEFICYGTV